MRLLGPVFWFDLVRVARRQPLVLWRSLYGLSLLAALFVLYASSLPEAMFGGHVSKQEASAFANRFADMFMAVQFVAVILITPAVTANAVAEERGRNTLPFLLGTHLSSREILLGKLFTRLLQVGLLILTGLPVLAMVQFMGGVDLSQIVAEYAALALTALSLGCLGVFCGVFVKKPHNAAWRAYQVMIAYFAVSMLSIWYFELPGKARLTTTLNTRNSNWQANWLPGSRPVQPVSPMDVSVEMPDRVLEWFNQLNPYFARRQIEFFENPSAFLDIQWYAMVFANSSPHEALTVVLRDYAIAHGSLALFLAGIAIVRLRAVAAKTGVGVTHKKKLILRPAPHPPVRERPVLWKELYCEAKPRQRWLRVFFGRWFYCASFVPAYFLILHAVDQSFGELSRRTLFLVRVGGTAVVGLLCLRIALHAARSIGGERDRQTLDSLLTTQLTPSEIVRDKWWGSLLLGRWLFIWLVVHWCLSMMTFALHPLALVVLVIETVIYAAFAASLGIYFAVFCRTTKQALACTLLIGLVGTTLLPWGIGKVAAIMSGEPPLPAMTPAYYTRTRYQPPTPEQVGLVFVPPWVLARTAVPLKEHHSWYYDRAWYDFDTEGELFLPSIGIGVSVYAAAASALAILAMWRFGRKNLTPRPPSRFGKGENLKSHPLPVSGRGPGG
jgi:ABC-type transport system involved in multi-copper enzyme maturation permease subunit